MGLASVQHCPLHCEVYRTAGSDDIATARDGKKSKMILKTIDERLGHGSDIETDESNPDKWVTSMQLAYSVMDPRIRESLSSSTRSSSPSYRKKSL